MRERRRTYELMFIISPLRSSEDDVAAAIGRVEQSIVGLGGEVTAVESGPPWGRRKFAYPIREYAEGEASRRSFTEGHYVLAAVTLPAAQIVTLERALKLNDAVLRYLLISTDGKTRPVVAAPASVAEGSAVAEAEAEAEEDEDEDEEADEDDAS